MSLLISLLAFSTLAAPAAAQQWPTLREELQKHGLDATGLDDADRRITSYAVSVDESWFAIAYYWERGTGLPEELRIRTLDRQAGLWRHNVLLRDLHQGGSALRIARRPSVIYVDLHITPSAGALIVLSEDLTFEKRLYGWSSVILPDGRVLYENSMVHFAPAHPGSVSLYDPRSQRDVRVYPAIPDEIKNERWIDRSIVKVEHTGPDEVRISVIEQDVLLGRDNRSTPDGEERRLSITCDISRRVPACVVRNTAR